MPWPARAAAIAAAAAAGLSFASLQPASATGDPELDLQHRARKAGIGAVDLGGPDESGLRVLGRIMSPAQTSARIASLLPGRSRNPAIGRNYAVDVVDVESGGRIWARRPSRPMLPASNMKIVTAANVLRALGPDHAFHTTTTSPGPGVVVLHAGGDATLTSGDLKLLAAQTAQNLQRNGLEPPVLANGNRAWIRVLVDNSLFPSGGSAPGWRSGYVPWVVRPVSALALDGDYSWDPAGNAARAFAAHLRDQGYGAKVMGDSTAGGTPVGDHPSRSLRSQVKYMLQVSENNVAEMLYRHVARARGLVPTWRNSRKAGMQSLAEIGVPTGGLSLADGSGVSRNDRLTAVSLTTLLQRIAAAAADPEFEPIHRGGGLPLAGVTGTLSASAGRFTTRPSRCARGRIRAKTGTLYDTIALSGLTVGTDGRLKAFSILVNNRPHGRYSPLSTRRSVDAIAATVTGCW